MLLNVGGEVPTARVISHAQSLKVSFATISINKLANLAEAPAFESTEAKNKVELDSWLKDPRQF